MNILLYFFLVYKENRVYLMERLGQQISILKMYVTTYYDITTLLKTIFSQEKEANSDSICYRMFKWPWSTCVLKR